MIHGTPDKKMDRVLVANIASVSEGRYGWTPGLFGMVDKGRNACREMAGCYTESARAGMDSL